MDEPTLVLLLAGLVIFLTWRVLRGGFGTPARMTAGLTVNSTILGIAAIAAAVWMFGPARGVLIILVVAVHEFGHVAAYRVAGHLDARFRLIPFLGGVAISARPPVDHLHDVYITAMGPGICLGLLGLATALCWFLPFPSFWATDILTDLAVVTAVLNFFNLLPIYPLDGGRIARSVLTTISPGLARIFSVGVCVLLAGLALYIQAWFILFIALFGLRAALSQLPESQPAMRPAEAMMALGAWLAMLAAFGLTSLRFILSQFG